MRHCWCTFPEHRETFAHACATLEELTTTVNLKKSVAHWLSIDDVKDADDSLLDTEHPEDDDTPLLDLAMDKERQAGVLSALTHALTQNTLSCRQHTTRLLSSHHASLS